MRVWSRGLGRENLGLSLDQATIKTLDEVLEAMPDEARERFIARINGNRRGGCLALTGNMLPPAGWQSVIFIERKDVFHLLRKLITLKLFRLFF